MKKMEHCIILIMSGVYRSLVGSSNYSFSGQTEIIVGKALPKLKVHSLTFGCLFLSLSLSQEVELFHQYGMQCTSLQNLWFQGKGK